MAYLQNDIGSVTVKKIETYFLDQVVRVSWGLLLLATIYQFVFFAEVTNIIAVSAVALAWLIATKIWLRKEMLERYLISTFMILGFTASQFYFCLLFTTLENKPIIYNLELPEQVFLHSTLCLCVLVIAHTLYRFLMRFSFNRDFSFLEKAGFFDPPTFMTVWIMGFIGMASSFYVYFSSPDIGREITGSASDKLLQGLVPFSYAPFLIPMAKFYGSKEKTPKKYVPMIILYSILLFGMSMARNSRGAFIFGLTTPAFAYGLALLLGVFKTRVFTLRNIVVAGFAAWLLLGPFTDLGTAMLIVRGSRTDMPPSELIMQTLEALDDKKAIEARKADDRSESMDFDWDERYLDNLFTARFSNIKFNDASLITYSKVGQYDPDMQDFSLDQLIAVLPDPVIKMFHFDVDKEFVLSCSFGDYLYILSGGYGVLEGFRIGHIAGTGLATFGWWYLLLLGLALIPIFYLNDKLFRRKKGLELAAAQTAEERFKFSFCGILAITSFFQFLMIESVVHAGTYLIRGWLQMVILYFFIYHSARIVGNIIQGRKRRLSVTSVTETL